MSGKRAKAARRAERATLGISKDAERAEREFDALVRAKRAEIIEAQSAPVRSLDGRRRVLAWIALWLFVILLGLVFWR